MLARRWTLFPFAAGIFITYVIGFFWHPTSLRLHATFAAIAAVIGTVAYLTVPKPTMGQRARRRLLEGAVGLLVAVNILAGDPSLWWAQYATFPLFLSWVYANYRHREIALLLLIHLTLQFLGHGREATFVYRNVLPFFLLTLWVGFAAVYRAQERKKGRGVADRLHLYEREATTLERHAEGLQVELGRDERKKVHLANTIKDREKSFQTFLELLKKTFDPHTVALYLFDPQQEAFILKDRMTESDRFADIGAQPLNGIFLAAIREPVPVRLMSATGELRGLTYYSGVPKVRSVIAVPLRSQGLLKGLLILDRLEALQFSDDETESLELIAGQVAITMDQAESLHAHFDLMEELTNFYAAASALNRCLRVEDVVETVLDSAKQIAHYAWGVVVLHDVSSNTNRIVAEQGDRQAEFAGRTFACAPERGLVSWVVKNQMPLYYNDFRARAGRTPLFHKQLRVPNAYDSVLIVPLHLKGESIGALLFAAEEDGRFSKSVRKILEVTALQAAASLKNARMVDQLERLATTDGLTGLVNHRTFQEVLGAEIDRVGRHPAPVSLLLVDIDFFKKFNDEFGHPVGDFVLREIAQLLKKAVRKVDTVARYGGEEFTVVLVNTSAQGALQMAQRIVQEVKRSQFQNQGLTLNVTLSIGAATYPDDSSGREQLIECSDRALYEAKRTGRNRAVSYNPILGKMSATKTEQKLIEAAEDQLRRMVDQSDSSV